MPNAAHFTVENQFGSATWNLSQESQEAEPEKEAESLPFLVSIGHFRVVFARFKVSFKDKLAKFDDFS